LKSRHQSATSVLCRAFCSYLSSFCRPNVRAGSQSSEAFCGAKVGSSGVEVPYPASSGWPDDFVASRDCDVLVCVWTHEPIYRKVVLTAGGGSARGHLGHGLATLQVRSAECAL